MPLRYLSYKACTFPVIFQGAGEGGRCGVWCWIKVRRPTLAFPHIFWGKHPFTVRYYVSCRCIFRCSLFLLFLVCWEYMSWMDVEFCQAASPHQLIPLYGFSFLEVVFLLVWVDHADWFWNTKLPSHSQNSLHVLVVYSLVQCWIQFAFLKIRVVFLHLCLWGILAHSSLFIFLSSLHSLLRPVWSWKQSWWLHKLSWEVFLLPTFWRSYYRCYCF